VVGNPVLYMRKQNDVHAIGYINEDHAIEGIEEAEVKILQTRPKAAVQHPCVEELLGQLAIALHESFSPQQAADVKEQEYIDGRHDQLIHEYLMQHTPWTKEPGMNSGR